MNMVDWHTFVRQCGYLLDNEKNETLASREAGNPVLSFFLGEKAEEQKEFVQKVYKKYWHNVEQLRVLTASELLAEPDDEARAVMIEDKIFEMISTNAQIRNRQVSIVYYWDLLDGHYEEIKELVTNAKNPLELPRTVECNKLVFAICRQSVRGGCRKLRRRLFGSEENVEQGFLDWAAENKLSVVLLSDDTCGGILGEENMWQDYQIAADTAVIANSYYTPESWEGALTDPGTAMKNALRHGTLFSAAYYRVARDTDEIACVTLSAILQAYKEKIEKSGQELSGSLEEKICGKAGGYQNLFQTFFEEKLKTLLPNETEQEFLKYLPQMAVMQENKSEPRKGFFSRFAGNMREEKAAAITGTDPQVTKSVCMMAFRQYYQEPIRQWLASEEGKTQTGEWFAERITRRLSFEEIEGRLSAEAGRLRNYIQNGYFDQPKDLSLTGTENPQQLHGLFEENCEKSCNNVLAGILADEMQKMTENIGDFRSILTDAGNNLTSTPVDAGVKKAYGDLTIAVLRENEDLLLKIHPGDMDDLQDDMREIYQAVIGKKSQYRCSLQQELSFLQKAGAGAQDAAEMVDFVNRDITRCAYFPLFMQPSLGSMRYCMLSANTKAWDDEVLDKLGTIFSTNQSDCMERLQIFPVQKDQLAI